MNALSAVSRALARAEMAVAAVLGLLIAVLILLNVVTRTSGNAIYWVDEAAITAMVWMSFLGASASIHYRSAVAMTLLTDMSSGAVRRVIIVLADLLVLAFVLTLLVCTQFWFDPIGLVKAGFSTDAFSAVTFNFIYSETTTTLGIRKFWLWSIMPIFCMCAAVHATANLLTSGAAEQRGASPTTTE